MPLGLHSHDDKNVILLALSKNEILLTFPVPVADLHGSSNALLAALIRHLSDLNDSFAFVAIHN